MSGLFKTLATTVKSAVQKPPIQLVKAPVVTAKAAVTKAPATTAAKVATVAVVGTGAALYMSGTATAGCEKLMGKGECAWLDQPRTALTGVASSLKKQLGNIVTYAAAGALTLGAGYVANVVTGNAKVALATSAAVGLISVGVIIEAK